ncbi:MAG: RNA polymerase sigma factor [Planctomycetota bacterium]
MVPPPRDDALVQRAAQGDRAAFGALIERHGAGLRFALEGRIQDRDAAADVAQETWVRVARGLAGFRVGMRFRPWLFAVGFNALRDHRRKLGARAEASTPTSIVEEEIARPSALAALAAVDEREAIQLALDEVEEPYQSALRLVDVLGLDYAEAAEALSWPEGTVKSRLSRGRRAFRAAYARLVDDDDPLQKRGAEPVPSNQP